MPSIIYMFLNGNNLETVAGIMLLRNTIAYLGIARCNLHTLPADLSKFKSLSYFDARDNYLTSLDSGLKTLLEANNVESYFSGNDKLCSTDTSLDCEPLCSKTCWSRKVSGNGRCDLNCNLKECDYDDGDCIDAKAYSS